MKNFNKRLKNSLNITLLVFTILVIGYLISSCSKLNDNNVPREYFNGKMFQTYDNMYCLLFSEEGIEFVFVDSVYRVPLEYRENIFIFTCAEEDFKFIVIDNRTLYSDKLNKYLYYLG